MSLGQRSWTFLTNQTQVLLCIAQNSDVRLRDVAEAVGITERAAQRLVADLAAAGGSPQIRRRRRAANRESGTRTQNKKGETRCPCSATTRFVISSV
jgi:DNA-binding MarR family transcriptional regulator